MFMPSCPSHRQKWNTKTLFPSRCRVCSADVSGEVFWKDHHFLSLLYLRCSTSLCPIFWGRTKRWLRSCSPGHSIPPRRSFFFVFVLSQNDFSALGFVLDELRLARTDAEACGAVRRRRNGRVERSFGWWLTPSGHPHACRTDVAADCWASTDHCKHCNPLPSTVWSQWGVQSVGHPSSPSAKNRHSS